MKRPKIVLLKRIKAKETKSSILDDVSPVYHLQFDPEDPYYCFMKGMKLIT